MIWPASNVGNKIKYESIFINLSQEELCPEGVIVLQ